jgi:VIT1/CCC1 family predicted Fe2+/Mn2+ transporter
MVLVALANVLAVAWVFSGDTSAQASRQKRAADGDGGEDAQSRSSGVGLALGRRWSAARALATCVAVAAGLGDNVRLDPQVVRALGWVLAVAEGLGVVANGVRGGYFGQLLLRFRAEASASASAADDQLLLASAGGQSAADSASIGTASSRPTSAVSRPLSAMGMRRRPQSAGVRGDEGADGLVNLDVEI